MPDYPVTPNASHDVSPVSHRRSRIRETSGPTNLLVGDVADGEYLKRDGDAIVGAGGGGVGSSIDETELAFTDVVTANSSSTKHGLLAKLSNIATEVLDGQGAWRTIAAILGFTPANAADVPVKASGAELDTGTDDAKFATAKALVDSSYAKTTDITAAAVGLESVNNTSDADKPVSSATQTALDLKPTINPTDGVVPSRSSAGAFIDSPLQRASASSVVVQPTANDGMNVLRINYANGSSSVQIGNISGYSALWINLLANAPTNTNYVLLSNFTSLTVLQSPGGKLAFNTGSTERFNISTSGHFVAGTDNAYDIGAAGATRPRTLYLGTGLAIEATITAAATTGAQTIDKTAGSVNFAAGAGSLVVTNNKVTVDSIIIATVATNDGTLKSVQAVAGAGSFTLFGNATATAETRVNFWVLIPD